MGDKVYPVVEHASAPPYLSRSSSMTSSVAIQMPPPPAEREVKKEQERRLISSFSSSQDEAGHGGQPQQHQYYIDQNVPQKDFIYGTAAPLPPDHPSRLAARRRGRRHGFCCRFLCGFIATLAVLAVIVGIAALVLYLVLRPKLPEFSVTDASVAAFNLTAGSAATSDAGTLYLDSDVTLSVLARNPNKKIGIKYDSTDVSLSYEGWGIGEGSIPPFYQGHRNTTTLALHMVGDHVPLSSSLGPGLQTTLQDPSSTIPLHARVLTKVRIKIGSWTTRASTFRVNCDVQISNPTVGDTHLVSKSCSVKLKKLRI